MKLPITENGVTLPKAWFGDATEVEVLQENGHVTIEPVEHAGPPRGPIAYGPDDPIWKLGKLTSDLEITDASVNLDKYLYDEPAS
jgi:hypothetical protein